MADMLTDYNVGFDIPVTQKENGEGMEASASVSSPKAELTKN